MIEKVKTSCCNTGWKRIGRAHFICVKCKRDVTTEIVLVYQVLEDEAKNNTNQLKP